MSIIEITPERLNREAEELLELKRLQEGEMSRLRALVYTLDSQWKGEAHMAFVIKFSSMEYVYRNFENLLESYARLMKSAANQMRQTDENLQRQINNI